MKEVCKFRITLSAILVLLIFGSSFVVNAQEISIFEEFTKPGKPVHAGVTWRYRSELAKVTTWEQIIPGDGLAYIRVNGAKNRLSPEIKWPFQMLMISPIGPNHSISIRAKNMVLPGVASFIFTYTERGGLSEIDLEIVGQDRDLPARTGLKSQTNWTDLRMNLWNRAPLNSDTAERFIHQGIVNSKGGATSHQDDRFHIYQLDWYQDRVEFFIDSVKQGEFIGNIPTTAADLNIGVRHMAWTGQLSEKPKTLLIDWIKIQPLLSQDVESVGN
ncbi:hypothetical protein GCM10007978_13750 [Shewanella hanedai]|nr:glycoside hydrolase family 16 protein [Shewanella hanedai]GGI77344.1 hypothetical protein GCM10007978_13750 [Shewanella hanedai]